MSKSAATRRRRQPPRTPVTAFSVTYSVHPRPRASGPHAARSAADAGVRDLVAAARARVPRAWRVRQTGTRRATATWHGAPRDAGLAAVQADMAKFA